MKSAIISLFLLFVPVVCFSEVIDIGSSCPDGSLYKNTPRVISGNHGVYGSDTCDTAMDAVFTSEMGNSDYSGGSCSHGADVVTLDCSMVLMHICCDTSWILAKSKMEYSIMQSSTVSDVPVGQEKTTADTFLASFDAANAYKDLTAGGWLRTDGLKGYTYTSAMGTNESLSVVTVNAWKRGGYAQGSNITTLENLTGGGGGLTQDQLTAGVTSALNTAGLNASTLKTKMDDAFDRAHNLGYMTGLTAGDAQNAVKGALDDKFPSASGTAGSSVNETGYSYSKEGVTVKEFETSWSDFSTNMKTTDLYGIGSGFFDNVPSSGSAHVVAIDGGDTFGSHEFDFETLSPWLAILRGVIVICFSFVAVKIVMINKG